MHTVNLSLHMTDSPEIRYWRRLTCITHDESGEFDRLIMKLSHTIRAHIYQSPAAAELDMSAVMDDGRKHGLMGVQEVAWQQEVSSSIWSGLIGIWHTWTEHLTCLLHALNHITDTQRLIRAIRGGMYGDRFITFNANIPANRERSENVLARLSLSYEQTFFQ